MTGERPLNERPAAKPLLPDTQAVPESTPRQIRNAKIFGVVAGLVVVGIPILVVLGIIAGNNAKEEANEKAYAEYQQTVALQKSETATRCYSDIATYLGQPVDGTKQITTYQSLAGTTKLQGIALGGQFTCIYTNEADVSKKKIKQLAWDRMDGSAPTFYIP